MSKTLLFPSEEWCRAVAKALEADPVVQQVSREFGAVTAGLVIERGGGLASDFCVYARSVPGKPVELQFPDDEDELEELEPDYLAWAPYPLCRDLLEKALAGGAPDPLKLVTGGKVKLKGDLQRIVRMAGKHPHAGLEAFRGVQTKFL